ncbi:DUF2235 domain-containing protein [Altererythrobacter confluentis]|uniref:DUF2235 domain-containing protein n=1 Tax=Allopontixanthobacter confluentis TaxID=1849021 RepID=A0A6L7GJS0_9SPHN|nr:DUF2235 domain-containing protein [Allopontixanthobacter confluentis]MXP15766.1 DUF2235 domain-containing protein [Allopontixanthobacter confluentis]
MAKNILIFSDGTGQIGGVRPDQKLSNIYKLYRATRPGPSSPIDPRQQFAFYDPGLGKGEVSGWTFKRTKHFLEATIGTGIDTNIIDCYEAVVAAYEPGDRICVFGFSRGAYTVRALATVLNLCGVPTQLPNGSPMPKYGKTLRKIAREAVQEVYNHGAGKPRSEQPYFDQREELGRRFRIRYGSSQNQDPAAPRGNVEPHFIGVFDSVAALGSDKLKLLFSGALLTTVLFVVASFWFELHWAWKLLGLGSVAMVLGWLAHLARILLKSYSPIDKKLEIDLSEVSNSNLKKRSIHWAFWRTANYDKYLSGEVNYARHAMAIDEERADFPRVKWGPTNTPTRRVDQVPRWLKQVWFAGCHSDIGGSYRESESRLSDIALSWMVQELQECVPEIVINNGLLQTFGDHRGLQHEERWMSEAFRLAWKKKPRYVYEEGELHHSVFDRFEAGPVPIVDEIKYYRPEQLKTHNKLKEFYSCVDDDPNRP